MNRAFFSISGAILFSVGTALADTPLILNDEAPSSASWIEQVSNPSFPFVSTTLRTNQEIYEQDSEVLIPLFSNADNSQFAFSTITHNFRDSGAVNLSGGFYYRFEVPGLNSVLGLSMHGDATETDYSNNLEQFGFGFDLFTRMGFDFHGNLYFAESEGSRVGSWYGDPFARGHNILQREFGIVEQGLSGGDFRVTFPVPLISKEISSRGFVGAYSFDGATDDISGLMTGIDFYPLQGVAVGVEYFADDEFYGDNWVFKAGATIPINNVFSLKDWQSGIGSALSPHSLDRDSFEVRSRMAGPRRKWVLTEFAHQNNHFGTHTVASDIIFVNSGGAVGNGIQAGSKNGIGTAQNPTRTIQRGANLVSSRLGGEGTVYVQGGRRYGETVQVGMAGPTTKISNIRFTTSYKPIQAYGGKVFGGDTARPILNGGFYFTGANGLRSVEVTGFDIRGGNAFDGHGISSMEVPNFLATCNFFHDTLTDGINVQNLSGRNATTIISMNRFRDSTRDAIEIDHVVGKGRESNILVWGNVGRNQSDGVEIEVEADQGKANMTVADNKFFNNGDQGLDLGLTLDSHATGTVKVLRNRVNNTTGNEGVYVGIEAYESSSATLMMRSNKVQKTTNEDGSYVYFEASDNSDITGVIANNVFRGSNDDGLATSDNSAANNSNINLTITGNKFLKNSYGYYLETDWSSGSHTVNIANNVARGNRSDGFYIEVDMESGAKAVVNIDSNRLVGNGDDGAYVYFDLDSGSSILGNIRNNLAKKNGGDGFDVYDMSATGDSDMAIVITGNRFLGNGGNGLDFETDWADGGEYSVTISNNLARGNSDNGFEIDIDAADENAAIPLVISGNTFLNNGGSSLDLDLDSDAGVVVSGKGNTSSGAGSGFSLEDNDTVDATGSVQIDGATINFPSPGDIPD